MNPISHLPESDLASHPGFYELQGLQFLKGCYIFFVLKEMIQISSDSCCRLVQGLLRASRQPQRLQQHRQRSGVDVRAVATKADTYTKVERVRLPACLPSQNC